jgi:phosphatidylserine/phosphatidylglycerophosphate/cardiolipin synthase-like enzyme
MFLHRRQTIREARRSSGRRGQIALALITISALVLTLMAAAPSVYGVPIGNLHCNDSQGRPAAPYQEGVTVTVSGIITLNSGVFQTTRLETYLQDATGGVSIYKNQNPPPVLTMGDSVTVTGVITLFRGLTEVVPGTITVHSSGHPVPAPQTLTCDQVAHQFHPNYCEPEESKLIRLARVTYTGTWAAGSTVTLHDDSGTCDMYIAFGSGVGSLPPPQAYFDVVGILKQFDQDYSLPFNTDYELCPRITADITPLTGPAITFGPEETIVGPDIVTIHWVTDEPANSLVEYGYTDQYEIDSIFDPPLVTDHVVTLGGLEAAKIHMYRVTSVNSQGDISVGGFRFCSGSRSTGHVDAYFTKSVLPALAIGEVAHGSTDLVPILVQRINAAQHSIDVAIYSFSLVAPADALISAHQRGVKIRFICEVDGNQDQINRLRSAGITVIDDTYGLNTGSGEMHDKFWVFDHRYDSDPMDDYVMTGSWNVSQSGTYTDAQNIVLIQDESIAEVYTAEINEMWGSTGDLPDANLSKFSGSKQDDTPKKFLVGGIPTEVYFGPSDHTMATLANRCSQAEHSAHFCILSFTRTDVGNALKNLYYGIEGFKVRGVFDSGSGPGGQYDEMSGGGTIPWNPVADVHLDAETGLLHHKYMILDVNETGGHPAVITGSSNWSNSADTTNDENMIYFQDFRLANLYYQEFGARYYAAGGVQDLGSDVPELMPAIERGLTAYPNPARDILTVGLPQVRQAGSVEISLCDPSGRKVSGRTVEVKAGAGQAVPLSLKGVSGGVYFVRVMGSGIREGRTVTVVR